MRDELLAREIFYSLKEEQVLIEMWGNHYNHDQTTQLTGLQTASSSHCRDSTFSNYAGWANIVTGTYFGGRSYLYIQYNIYNFHIINKMRGFIS